MQQINIKKVLKIERLMRKHHIQRIVLGTTTGELQCSKFNSLLDNSNEVSQDIHDIVFHSKSEPKGSTTEIPEGIPGIVLAMPNNTILEKYPEQKKGE